MADSKEKINIYADWNPWHGCTKISPGCKYCYVYRQDKMYQSEKPSNICRKNQSFDLPVRKKRDGTYKIPSGKIVFTCRRMASGLLENDSGKERLLLLFLYKKNRQVQCLYARRLGRRIR